MFENTEGVGCFTFFEVPENNRRLESSKRRLHLPIT